MTKLTAIVAKATTEVEAQDIYSEILSKEEVMNNLVDARIDGLMVTVIYSKAKAKQNKEEVLEKLKPLLRDELNIKIIKNMAKGLTPRQISNMGVCSYSVANSKCRAVANVLGVEYGSLHRARIILQVFMVKRGGNN